MNNIKLFSWTCLHDLVTWNQITTSCETFKNYLGTNLNEDQLFDEIGHLKLYLTKEKLTDWNKNNISTEDRWLEFFRFMKGKLVPVTNLKSYVNLFYVFQGPVHQLKGYFHISINIGVLKNHN